MGRSGALVSSRKHRAVVDSLPGEARVRKAGRVGRKAVTGSPSAPPVPLDETPVRDRPTTCPSCGDEIPPDRYDLHIEGLDGARPGCPRQDLEEIVSRARGDLAYGSWAWFAGPRGVGH